MKNKTFPMVIDHLDAMAYKPIVKMTKKAQRKLLKKSKRLMRDLQKISRKYRISAKGLYAERTIRSAYADKPRNRIMTLGEK